MTRDGALSALRSESSHERLRGAQYFVENGAGGDLGRLRKLLAIERDTYVRRRLELALGQKTTDDSAISQITPADELPESPTGEAFARAVQWVGGVFTHEIEGPIGRVAYRASRELGENYEASKTKREIDYLKGVFEAITQLVVASRAPRPEEFDLSALIDEIVDGNTLSQSIDVTRHGPKPFVIKSDRALIGLALANGIKNALESISLVEGAEAHPVIVTWGSTDRDCWVSVIDKGSGLSTPVNTAFQMGTSTKSGHSGFGLAIARRAMESIKGTVTLQAGANVGACCELRWERT